MKNEEGVPCKEQRNVHSKRATHARALRQERTWCIKVRERRPVLLKGRIKNRIICGEVDHVRSLGFIVCIMRRYLEVLSRV